NIVLSLKEKNINSPEDLIGKTVGYAGSPLSEAEIETVLENAGASIEDINFIDVGFELLTATTTGEVDATIGSMVNHEVPQLEEQGFEVAYFFPIDHGVPDCYELVLLTGEDQVKNNPDKLKKFLRAVQKGFEFTKENPEEALQILLANQNEENFPLSETVEKKSLEILLPAMETEYADFLSQDIKVWQENADWMYEKGILDKKVDTSDIVVNLLE
ncbi:MAG TPA: ABC transporter substrate-binding protein, partial [Clostridia bacterium]|nr:ABC transporter substrate-binding protein [Clostridia bacterium]